MQFINTPGNDPRNPELPKGVESDAPLLDAYSQAVIGVVQKTSPAVIHVSGRDQKSSGSGFLISDDGLAVTNYHVASHHVELVSRTSDGDRIATELLGADPANDIALLKLNASDLPSCELGDSAKLQVGQLVVAIGSPLGLQSTVSSGIVSATGRSMRGEDGRLIDNVVQHSAPINPGNSGGPLVDSTGKIIGVNTAIIAMAQGLCFAVSSNTVQWVVDELKEHGTIRRRQLGIAATTVRIHRDDVIQFDLLSNTAVEVVEIEDQSLASRNGIQPGDLIVEINDRIVSDVDDVHRLLSNIPSQTVLTIAVIRNQRKRIIKIQ